MLIAFAGVILAIVVASAVRSRKSSEAEAARENVYTEVPDGDVDRVPDSKSDA